MSSPLSHTTQHNTGVIPTLTHNTSAIPKHSPATPLTAPPQHLSRPPPHPKPPHLLPPPPPPHARKDSHYTRLSLLSIVDEIIHPSLKSALPYCFKSLKSNTFEKQFRAPKFTETVQLPQKNMLLVLHQINLKVLFHHFYETRCILIYLTINSQILFGFYVLVV